MEDSVDRLLDQWRTERPDIDPAPMGVVGRISRAHHWLGREIGDNFAAFGLQRHEFDIIATLRRAGSPYQLTAGALVETSMVTSGAITNRIDRLVTRGLVTRETDPANRRSVHITLTEEGLRLVDDVVAHHVELEARLLGALAPDEQDQLAGLLRRLLVSLGDAPDHTDSHR